MACCHCRSVRERGGFVDAARQLAEELHRHLDGDELATVLAVVVQHAGLARLSAGSPGSRPAGSTVTTTSRRVAHAGTAWCPGAWWRGWGDDALHLRHRGGFGHVQPVSYSGLASRCARGGGASGRGRAADLGVEGARRDASVEDGTSSEAAGGDRGDDANARSRIQHPRVPRARPIVARSRVPREAAGARARRGAVPACPED